MNIGDIVLLQSKETQNVGMTCEILSVCEDGLHIIVKPVDSKKWFPQMPFISDFSFKVFMSYAYITVIKKA